MMEWKLTPGLMAMNVKPSSANDNAYCTVNILRAALEILYAGTGIIAYLSAWVMEPTVVDLVWCQCKCIGSLTGIPCAGKLAPNTW